MNKDKGEKKKDNSNKPKSVLKEYPRPTLSQKREDETIKTKITNR